MVNGKCFLSKEGTNSRAFSEWIRGVLVRLTNLEIIDGFNLGSVDTPLGLKDDLRSLSIPFPLSRGEF